MSYRSQIDRLQEQLGNLLAKHEETRDLVEFHQYADDPAGFMREVLRCDPWALQVRMAEMIRDNSRTIIVSCNGAGKDWVTARIAMWWVYARRGMVIVSGPTERQVKQIVLREVRRAFAAAPELPGELYATELRVGESGECGILAMTSDSMDRLTGFHHPRLLICVTEGQGVDEQAYEAAFACATSPENRIFIYGNPTRPTGPFYRAANSDNWSLLRIPATEHPNVISGRMEIPGAVSREWIELMREEYGAASSIYRSRVLAEFPDENVEGLVQRAWLRAANERHAGGELLDVDEPLTLALDVARFGADKSVLAIVQGPVVRELVTWGGLSITDTADRVLEHANRLWQADAQTALARFNDQPTGGGTLDIWVDEPGLGGGCIDILRERVRDQRFHMFRVHAFNGAERSRANADRYLNLRAESHWHFRTLLESNRIALPADALLEEEALAVEWQINQSGQIQILGKDLLRSTLGRSPDRLDAVIIGLAGSMGLGKPDLAFTPWYRHGQGPSASHRFSSDLPSAAAGFRRV
jgi:phage terminase large subunit